MPNLYNEIIEIYENYGEIAEIIKLSETCCFSTKQTFDTYQKIDFREDPVNIKEYLVRRMVKNDILKIKTAWNLEKKRGFNKTYGLPKYER